MRNIGDGDISLLNNNCNIIILDVQLARNKIKYRISVLSNGKLLFSNSEFHMFVSLQVLHRAI